MPVTSASVNPGAFPVHISAALCAVRQGGCTISGRCDLTAVVHRLGKYFSMCLYLISGAGAMGDCKGAHAEHACEGRFRGRAFALS